MSVVYSTFGGRVLAENRGGVIRQYLPDPLGNTAALADTTGTITDTYTYWPYGEVRTHIGTSTTPLTFLGTLGYFVDSVKQLYVRARHLRVDLTQWMTVDPTWPSEGAYRYCRSTPTSAADPSGLFAWVPVVCAVACAGCLLCLAGFIWQCYDCGLDLQCWISCIREVINGLPWWAQAICAGACIGCLLCLFFVWLAAWILTLIARCVSFLLSNFLWGICMSGCQWLKSYYDPNINCGQLCGPPVVPF